MISVSELKKEQFGRIICFQGHETLACRLMEMGLYVNDEVQLVDTLFFGRNLIIISKSGKYVLRKKEADCIKVEALV